MLKAVIMQPTYLPWAGYFDLMDQCDVFVFFDSVQFDKRSWQQRNRIKSPQGELLLTVPVLSKGRYDQKINEVIIDPESNFQEKHIRAIKCNYAKAKFFKQYIEGLEHIFSKKHVYLADLNIELTGWFKDVLGITAKLIRSSALEAQGKKAELLVEICKEIGAKAYLSPNGARDYIDGTDVFEKNEIELHYHDFNHPAYVQLYGDFISHLSIIDLLFNEGDNSLSVIRSGRGRK